MSPLNEKDFGPEPMAQFERWFEDARQRSAQRNPNAMTLCTVGTDGWPQGELVFHWDALGRQVRARGPIERISDAQSDAYFASRPRGSQLAAWASQQSEPVASRESMDERYAKEEARFEVQDVKRPPHWFGYRLKPQRLEFWQEAASRFHDRFEYRLQASGAWALTRLNP